MPHSNLRLIGELCKSAKFVCLSSLVEWESSALLDVTILMCGQSHTASRVTKTIKS